MDKEKLLIIGAGGLGRVVLEMARHDYACALIDDGIPVDTKVDSSFVIGDTSSLQELYKSYQKAVVAIGNNVIRERVMKSLSQIGYRIPSVISPSAYLSEYASVGEGCIILNNAVVQNGSHVGNGVILNSGVEIHHDSYVDDYALIYTNTVIRTQARVGKRAWIGSTLTIGNQVIVEDDQVVENGQTLKKNTETD